MDSAERAEQEILEEQELEDEQSTPQSSEYSLISRRLDSEMEQLVTQY